MEFKEYSALTRAINKVSKENEATEKRYEEKARRSPDFQQPIEIGEIHSGGAYFTWSQPTVGFGELSIGKNPKTGRVTCSNEGMSKEWCRRALYAAVDKLLENVEFH